MPLTSQSDRLPPTTVSGKVYNLLREDIISGVFPPGAHLVRRTLAKKYGVSALPVMEACFKLETDGLVENSPLLGAHVINITPEEIDGDRVFREAIECQAAREFSEWASARNMQKIRALAADLDAVEDELRSGDRGRERQFHMQHSEFHIMVAKLSDAKPLYRQMKNVWYRRLMIACNVNTILFPNPPGWHISLAEQLCSGDADRAEDAMRRHVQYNRSKNADSVREVIRRGRNELIDGMLVQGRVAEECEQTPG